MKKTNFPAFKFLSLDYAFENIMKHKLAVSSMLIPFPNEILQEENYCHSRIFVNDTYRRPWERSIPTYKIQEEDSTIDLWKTHNFVDDFLERREEAFAIVPSSNPCSQIDLEDVCSVNESAAAEASHTAECWKTIPSNDTEYFLPEEVVFVDFLAQYRQHIPRLSTLLNRLKIIPVPDPLTDWKETLPAKEILFRIDPTFEKDLKPDLCLEEFHHLLQNREEHLFLPSIIEVGEHASKCRSYVSDLMTVLQLAPEEMLETSCEGWLTQIILKQELIEQNSTDKTLDLNKYEDIVNKVYLSSYQETELEVPFSPTLKDARKEPCINLAEEDLSPICSSFHIIDIPADILVYPESLAEIQFPLCKVPFIQFIPPPHHTIDQLMELICIKSDKLEDSTLEDNWWNKFGLTVKYTILESLNSNSATDSMASKNLELVSKITPAQLEGILEEKQDCVKQRDNCPKTCTQFISCSPSSSQISVSCLPLHRQINATFHTNSKEANTTLVTHEENQKTEKSRTFSEFQDYKKNSPSVTKVLSIDQVNINQTSYKAISKAHKQQDFGINEPGIPEKNDVDPLSSFIILRTKRSLDHGEEKHTDNHPVHVNDAENRKPEHSESQEVSCDVVSLQKCTEEPKHQMHTVHFTASESQCQAYCVLQAAAVPILNKLTGLGVSACADWRFASVSFDSTRFLLCQQEKTLTNRFKIGKKSHKDLILFKNASFLHILVTLRDLIMMCNLDAALEYLCNAKSMYKSALESSLDDVWRILRIIQYVQNETKEVNPKITALLKWMKETYEEEKQLKQILVLSRMDSEAIKETLNNSTGKNLDLKAITLCPVSGHAFLDPRNVLGSLRKHPCAIVNNQYIGSDFPWAHFSLVIEYDCTDVWLKLCHDLNIQHITLKGQLPSPSVMDTSAYCKEELPLHIQIPYVFLSSEGLTNNPEILHVLESRYNMTFIERECSPSLQLFGKASHCALITVDESTVIILQSLEALMPDKSAENLILKLVALSLQYSCCWVLLYAKERLNSEYSLSGIILHSIALVYAAITAYLSRSEDLQIKTFISSGLEKTGLLVRCIADHTLLSASDPYEWLDKSWLSILLSEEEKVLLSFPSINPMVAQRMLRRGSSLQWVLSATNDQLNKLFPETPSKVLKHFSDITALHKLSALAASQRPCENSIPAAIEDCCSFSLDIAKHNSCNAFVSNKILPGNNGLLKTFEKIVSDNASKSSTQNEEVQKDIQQYCQKTGIRDSQDLKQIRLSSNISTLQNCYNAPEQSIRFSRKYYSEATFLGFSRNHNMTALAENISEQHPNQPTDVHESSPDMLFGEEDGMLESILPGYNYYGTEDMSSFSINREHFFANICGQQNSTNPVYDRNKQEDLKYISKEVSTENRGSENIPSQVSSVAYNEHLDGLQLSQMAIAGKRRFSIDNAITKETIPSGIPFSQLPQQKRRKLMYERVPGRCDGQTRLKFF